MRRRLAVVFVIAISNFASADTIRGINIDFVNIGNAGNVADTQVMSDGTTGYGSVGYNYRIGKYEVTNAQWNTFTAVAGAPIGKTRYSNGYHFSAYFTGAQQPTNEVSWYETFQFCNYLTSGDKSKGVYQFSGDNSNPGDFLGIDRDTAIATYGTTYFLPTENEWYKAAYFKPNGSGYSLYANGTNTAPLTSQTCYSIYLTPWDVGTGVQEQNGTFDMMGNVWEWNETLSHGLFNRCLRGGSLNKDADTLSASSRYYVRLESEFSVLGFRVASIPEPCSLVLLSLGGLLLRRRKK